MSVKTKQPLTAIIHITVSIFSCTGQVWALRPLINTRRTPEVFWQLNKHHVTTYRHYWKCCQVCRQAFPIYTWDSFRSLFGYELVISEQGYHSLEVCTGEHVNPCTPFACTPAMAHLKKLYVDFRYWAHRYPPKDWLETLPKGKDFQTCVVSVPSHRTPTRPRAILYKGTCQEMKADRSRTGHIGCIWPSPSTILARYLTCFIRWMDMDIGIGLNSSWIKHI